MIQPLTQQISELSGFPDRQNYTSSSAYAQSVATWLEEQKDSYPELNTLFAQINIFVDEANTTIDSMNDDKTATESFKDEALGYRNETESLKDETEGFRNDAFTYISTLPTGVLNDSITSNTNSWSSQKIAYELANLSSVASINDLTDVDTTGITSDQVLIYNGTAFVAGDMQGGSDINIDGGRADSIYTANQIISGGNA
jgi:hypothetical protein